jgi:hypothetical protein
MPNSSSPSEKIKCLSEETRWDSDVEIRPFDVGCVAIDASFVIDETPLRALSAPNKTP